LGKECLGYGTLWRWTDSVASRGKLSDKKIPLHDQDHPSSSQTDADAKGLTVTNAIQGIDSNYVPDLDLDDSIQLSGNLTDPLFCDMSSSDRYYLSYCLSSPAGLPLLFTDYEYQLRMAFVLSL
jgi:hypothetical protein